MPSSRKSVDFDGESARDGGLPESLNALKFHTSLSVGASEDHKLCTLEAEAAVKEVAFAVREIRIAEALPFNESLAYLNLTTLEGDSLCVQISASGFRPVGIRYDDVSGRVPPPANDFICDGSQSLETYETVYALLSARSSGFRDRFSQVLAQRLTELQQAEKAVDT